jgi:hypothetical protein
VVHLAQRLGALDLSLVIHRFCTPCSSHVLARFAGADPPREAETRFDVRRGHREEGRYKAQTAVLT